MMMGHRGDSPEKTSYSSFLVSALHADNLYLPHLCISVITHSGTSLVSTPKEQQRSVKGLWCPISNC